ncbi:hypothetical protein TNCV_4460331 [Trichonephila clavipes]|nr:hypothetical protein TNCV_4460331 [Trichonephila clavipes]
MHVKSMEAQNPPLGVDRLSPLFFEHLDRDELRFRIDRYNALYQSSEMVLETDFGGMCFPSPPLRVNSLAKGAYILTPASFITPINNWERQRIFPLENKTTKRQRPLRCISALVPDQ